MIRILTGGKMKTINSLASLYKRDTKGKVRIWTIEVGYDSEDVAGIRTIAGLLDGQKVTSEWNMCEAKNVGRANATTARTQAEFEAQAEWTKKSDKEYFDSIDAIDSFTAFKPMLAHDFAKTPVTSGYTQPKLDGIRCIASAKGLYSRAFKPIVAVPHIAQALEFLKGMPNITLDGELYNHELKDNFQKITSLVRKTVNIGADEIAESKQLVQYHIYDMYDSNNPNMTFTERYVWLQNHIKFAGEYAGNMIQLVRTTKTDTPEAIDNMYGEYTTAGYEGQMIRQDTPYENKRSKNLLKRKEFITEEYEVVEVHEGQGNWSGYAKRLTLKMPNGTTFSSGIRGSQAQLRALLESSEKPTWATCRYFELSNDGIPRFPVTIDYGTGVRDD